MPLRHDRPTIARSGLIALAALAGAAAVWLRFWWTEQITPRPISDASFYWTVAKAFAAGEGYTSNGVPTAYRPIGYSAALAPFVWALGDDVAVARTFNAAISVFTLAGVHLLTLTLTGSSLAALVALCVFGFYPADVGYTSVVLSELLFNALSTIAVCSVVLRPRSLRLHALAGCLLGFATLTRPHAALVIPLLVLAAFLRDTPKKEALRLSAALVVASALTLAPWWIRNAQVFHAFVPVSTNGGVNLYIGNHPEANGAYTFDKARKARIDARVPAELQGPAHELRFDREAARLAYEFMQAEPERTVALWKLKLESLYLHEGAFSRFSRKLPEEQRPLLQRLGAISVHYYMRFLLVAAVGFAVAVLQLIFSRAARARPLWLPAAIVAAFTGLTLLTFGDSRFHHPIMPWLAIYAGVPFAALAQLAALLYRRLRT